MNHLLTHLFSQEFHKAPFWATYDVSSLELSEGSVLNLYADDMLLYKPVKCSEDYQQLHSMRPAGQQQCALVLVLMH